MAVIVVPRDSSMQLRLVTGAPIIESKTFNKVKATALDQDIYEVTTALIGLQKYPVDEIRAQKESQLTE
jgi:hypothetical protein